MADENKIFKLDKRLSMCAGFIRDGAKVVDIGTDHAYLVIYLAQCGRVKSAVASDLRRGPLENAFENIKKYGLEDTVKTRLSDGFSKINSDEVDDVVIAGMGGEVIAQIIKDAKFLKDPRKHLVLQPMTMAEHLRRFLHEEGFVIEKETATVCGEKVYSVMSVYFSGEENNISDLYPYIGGLEFSLNADACEYIKREIKALNNKIKGFICRKNFEESEKLSAVKKSLEKLISEKGAKGTKTVTRVKDIYRFIDGMAPFDTAMNFDNVGLIVGDENREVSRVLLALDITKNVVEEAKKSDAQLIVSHHPVIFNPIKSLMANNVVYKLAKCGISAVCAHTNLDVAENGVNKCLASALKLGSLEPLSFYEAGGRKNVMGLVGELFEEMQPTEFAKFVKKSLGCAGVRYTETSKKIKRVALCSGAGGDLIEQAVKAGADAFVTGEIKHHEILFANENDVCVVEGGHFSTENIVISPLVKVLKEKFPGVEFFESECCTDGVKYI